MSASENFYWKIMFLTIVSVFIYVNYSIKSDILDVMLNIMALYAV